MDLTAEEQAIKTKLDRYLADKEFTYYPDEEVVERVIKGLQKRKEKAGEEYCPCRLMTRDPEKDKGIICPCVYHEKEIEESGFCHCRLFATEGFEAAG